MKKLVLLFIVLLIARTGLGQNSEPARRYLSVKGEEKKYYSTESMKSFALEDNPKSKQFRELLLSKTGKNDINSVFENIRIVDTTLEAGTYRNSDWNPVSGKFEPFIGKYYKGKVTIRRQENGETKLLYKNACGNMLNFEEYDISLKFKGVTKEAPVKTQNVIKVATYANGLKQFTPAKVIPRMDAINTMGNKTPYIPPLKQRRQISDFGKIAIAVGATVVVGTVAFLIWKNQQKGPAIIETSWGHGIDPPPPDPGGGGVDPPPPLQPLSFGFGFAWSL